MWCNQWRIEKELNKQRNSYSRHSDSNLLIFFFYRLWSDSGDPFDSHPHSMSRSGSSNRWSQHSIIVPSDMIMWHRVCAGPALGPQGCLVTPAPPTAGWWAPPPPGPPSVTRTPASSGQWPPCANWALLMVFILPKGSNGWRQRSGKVGPLFIFPIIRTYQTEEQ